jgi:NADH dehydrogenase
MFAGESMRIFLTGATGFIGGHTLRTLVERGHLVTCFVRPSRRRNRPPSTIQRLKAMRDVRVVEGSWNSPGTWLDHVAGHNAVVNTVGIIRETRTASFDAVHTLAPVALFEAAARAGVQKIVQLSAMGADEAAQSRFHLSKRAADRRLAELGVPYVVLRPSFVYGPGDHSMTFFARLAALPLTPVPGDGQYRAQPVHVDDLVRTIALAVERDDLRAVTVDVGGGEVVTFDAMLDSLARQQGKRRGARKLHVPWGIMRVVAKATDLLGGYGPITGDELGMLRRGNFADNRPFVEHFGFEPIPFGIGIQHCINRAPNHEA